MNITHEYPAYKSEAEQRKRLQEVYRQTQRQLWLLEREGLQNDAEGEGPIGKAGSHICASVVR